MPNPEISLDYFRANPDGKGEPPLLPVPRSPVQIVIPILFCLLLAAVMAGAFVPIYVSGVPDAKIDSTHTSLATITRSLDNFEIDHDRFPTTAEGLNILVHRPPGMADWRVFLEKLPTDAWGHPFVYRCPSTTGQPFYDLYSLGPDGQDGTPDDIWPNP